MKSELLRTLGDGGEPRFVIVRARGNQNTDATVSQTKCST